MAALILLTIGMYIKPTRLLEVGPLNAKYDLKGRLCKKCTIVDWSDKGKIQEAMVANNDKDNDEKHLPKKIGN